MITRKDLTELLNGGSVVGFLFGVVYVFWYNAGAFSGIRISTGLFLIALYALMGGLCVDCWRMKYETKEEKMTRAINSVLDSEEGVDPVESWIESIEPANSDPQTTPINAAQATRHLIGMWGIHQNLRGMHSSVWRMRMATEFGQSIPYPLLHSLDKVRAQVSFIRGVLAYDREMSTYPWRKTVFAPTLNWPTLLDALEQNTDFVLSRASKVNKVHPALLL